jgi:hypothetical protein
MYTKIDSLISEDMNELIKESLVHRGNYFEVNNQINELILKYKKVEEEEGISFAFDMYKSLNEIFDIKLKLYFSKYKFVKIRFGIVTSKENYQFFMNRGLQIQDMEIIQHFTSLDSYATALKEYQEKFWCVGQYIEPNKFD